MTRAPAKKKSEGGPIRVGVGGWTYEPWRGLFYPEGLKHADELKYAGERLTAETGIDAEQRQAGSGTAAQRQSADCK